MADVQTPPEISVRDAATLLAVSPRHVLRLMHAGLLTARSVGLPTSRRPTYRLLRTEVLELKSQRLRFGWRPQPTSVRKATMDIEPAKFDDIDMS